MLQHSNGDVAVWLMNGSTITTGLNIGSPGAGWAVENADDYNGDGKADLLLRNTDGNVAEWQMDGATITQGLVIGNPGADWMVV